MEGKIKGKKSFRVTIHSIFSPKKQKQREKEGEFERLVEKLLSGKLSTRELQKELRKILSKGKEQCLPSGIVLKYYEKVIKELEEINVPKKFIESETKVLEQIKNI